MSNSQVIGFDEKGNAIVLIPVILPTGQIDSYLRSQYRRNESSK